jgi:NADH-quinone oxidoreductase subunit M
MNIHLLCILLLHLVYLAPLVATVVALFAPASVGRRTLVLAGVISGVAALLLLPAVMQVPSRGAEPLLQILPWGHSGVVWSVGATPFGILLAILGALIAVLAVLSSPAPALRPRAWHACMALLCTGMQGAFVVADLLSFFICWELTLPALFVLIGIWGGEDRKRAALRFALFAGASSVMFLTALLLLPGIFYGSVSRGPMYLFANLAEAGPRLPADQQGRALLVGGLFLLSFLVKVPALGLHVWLPHAHVQAPTAVSVVLAGVLLKFGVYGMAMIWPAFVSIFMPYLPVLAWIGTAGVLIGGLLALGQTDLKRIVAYSSVAHLGWCILGFGSASAAGYQGALFIALAHGVASPLLFLLVGAIYERAHHRRVDGFGGLAGPMPLFTRYSALAWLAAAGLPGLAGFPGEFLVAMGGLGQHPRVGVSVTWATMLACVGVLIAAAYALWTFQRVCLGPLRHPEQADYPDLSERERWCIGICAGVVLLLGVWPTGVLQLLATQGDHLLELARRVGPELRWGGP